MNNDAETLEKQVAKGLELSRWGATAAAVVIQTEGYPKPTARQFEALSKALAIRVKSLVLGPAMTEREMKEDLVDFLQSAALSVFGANRSALH